ncbi:hypothetical protein PoB_006776700 [Plakobranchus ocellatus]|uniref:Uncharacterized protein n=1 Tax=Plakobranchus ocellatus TaxID=259542 RepID=A0AAV4DAL7_9GAST|nr:hypothetical protein PoB_006776700 [Plakobranchus ocellatus]
MITPRVMTPASGLKTVSNKPPTVSTTSMKAHSMIQQPQHSLLDFDGELVEDYFSANSEPQRVPQSISNKYSSPIDRFDDAVARPPHRSSKPCIADNNSDQQGNGSGWAGAARQGRRENSSTQRARARLNQLLHEDEDNNIGASGNTASNGTRQVHVNRKSNVDSRSVMRQLDASKMKSSKNRGASNTVGNQDSRRLHVDNNSSNGSSGGASQVASGGARSRQRADHVFSPELRLKPDHNPRPKVGDFAEE